MARQRNDFSKGSIPKTILSLAAPMTMAQLINVLYSVVDRMYLGRLPGHLALTGLGLTMPIISILMGFANLCGMGGAPLCSIYRGKGENEEAEYVMGNSFTLLLILGVLATAVCLLIKKPMLYLFGASDATFPYADAYLTIYLLGTIFVMVSLGLNPFINSQGFAKTGMMTVGLGAVVNIVLDPIFIFVLDLGVQGAALATILAQGCSAVWVLHFLTGKKAILRLRLSRMVLTSRRVKRILSLGLAGFFVNLTNSLVQVVCNATLQTWGGDLYVGVMTILNSVRDILTMPVNGLTSGAQPVLGFNYGAQAYRRVKKGIVFMTLSCMAYTLVAWLLVFLFPQFFIQIFNTDDTALLQASIPALHMYFFGFFMMTFQFAGQSTFVALGKAKHAIFFSIFRKVIIVIPLTILLPGLFQMGVNGVFWAEPISNFVGGAASFITMLCTVWPALKEEKVLTH